MPSETAAKFVLHGHVVTMNDAFDEIAQGAVYVEGHTIQAVQPASKPAPAGFEGAPVVDTRGTIFPGLVELHNHLSYNALRLWNVPAKYANRDQWPDNPQYHQLVTGPMKLLGQSKRADLLAALVRHVESKCLFGGVTTSQGVALSSDAGVESFYKGVVRNVEHADDKAFPAAARTHIADVAAKDWTKFFAAVSGKAPVILHLSEGKDQKAREHFLALESKGKWAITNRLIGIHCAALQPADFDVMAKHGGSMVWSPLSNYLLYGDTADIAAARKSGVAIALGSDWSPSGSKNLLGELKAARLAADHAKAGLHDRDLVAMATRTPARMVGWDGLIGSLEKGKRADLLVIAKGGADAYGALIAARESDVALVLIDGVARYGTPALMTALGAKAAAVEVTGQKRSVQYHDPEANPEIDSLPLAEAEATLKSFFGNIPKPPAPPKKLSRKTLVLEELEPDKAQRPLLPFQGRPTGWSPAAKLTESVAGALPLKPLEVDPLTVVDDEKFVPTLEAEANLPAWLRAGLKEML
jgi:cytosine/adenosine deaminase-related metal-dependent hydrolase